MTLVKVVVKVARKIQSSESFLKSLNALTGISIRKIKNYSKEHNLFNILEHPMVVEPTEGQLKKINTLNEFISSYLVLRMKEEENRIKLGSAKEAGEYFVSLLGGMKDKERFAVAFLDNSNSVIETRIVSEGTVNMTQVFPRNILKLAIANDCTGLILSHNHPGRTLNFTIEDKSITQRMVDIFHPLNIRVLDHIVVGGNNYSSLAQKGHLPVMTLKSAKYDPIVLDNKVKEDSFTRGEEVFVNEDEEELEF
ncbi:DNA repair protein RadC [Maledivibacter halophilus]|uniref:DNA repair protein RadC n=1 Tax=Maledivibacter halophilus TaxID=36842 RepID=A0A1T5LPC6_9FIRM|nr:DNA repair protein RadC [Maledivibacter halophilus]